MQPEKVIVDPSLQSELKPGERLLWWGRSDPSHRAKIPGTQPATYIVYGLMTILLLVLIFFIFIIIFFFIRLIQEADTDFSGIAWSAIGVLLVFIIVLGVCAYYVYQQYSRYRKHTTDLKNTIYGITNQRVIVMTTSRVGLAVNSYRQNDIGRINRIETGGGWGDVSYGRVRQLQSGFRTLTVAEKLVGIPDVRIVEDILVKTFSNIASTPVSESAPGPPPPKE